MLRASLIIAGCLLLAQPAQAQSEADSADLEQLPQRFSAAWAAHDGARLARLMAEDVGFVTVGASWLQGRKDFETYHKRLLEGRFKDSTITPIETRLRFLRPDLAIIRWSWRIEGDKDFDGTPRGPRFGLFTMVAEKRGAEWQVVAAQNTNGGPGTAPENEGLVFPIALPRPPK